MKAKCPRCKKKHEVFKHPDMPHVDVVKCGKLTIMIKATNEKQIQTTHAQKTSQ